LVLSDEGIGGLGLGMTKKEAIATGMIGKLDVDATDASGGCLSYHGKDGIDLVYFSAGKASKIVIIAVKPSIKTDKSIGVGDTFDALHAQYPKAEDEAGVGRVYAAAPGASVKAEYRFGMTSGGTVFPKDKITEIALQAVDQPCYE
jgi:hypothetical protein